MQSTTWDRPIRSPRSTPYAIRPESAGWLIIGASDVAEKQTIPTLRGLPPLGVRDGDVGGKAAGGVSAWVVGIHSRHAGRAQQFAIENQIPHASDDLLSLLRRPEVRCVYIGNHPRHHAESIREAVLAGKHVLYEPPMALTVEEAESLVSLAQSSQSLLCPNYLHRLNPVLQTIHDQLQDGLIGEVIGGRVLNGCLLETRQRTWRLQENGGGVAFCHTLFDVDCLRFLLHDEVATLRASNGSRLFTKTLDEEMHTVLIMQRSKLFLQLYDSFLLPHLPTQIELYGEHGALHITHWMGNRLDTQWVLQRHGQMQGQSQQRGPAQRELAQRELAQRELTQNGGQTIDTFSPLYHLLNTFHQAIQQNRPMPVTAIDDLQAIAVVSGVRRALQSREGYYTVRSHAAL